ncbi:hypothetical protein SJAV_18630 [Sulfurisphaera javensis]|uniref:Uncharacterized protein n=1 Tax=Sulfurisphaera javensis TaxID=2049879 RepID=A0AAT9GSM7_9CREN
MFNGLSRDYLAKFRRETKVVSRSLRMIEYSIALLVVIMGVVLYNKDTSITVVS